MSAYTFVKHNFKPEDVTVLLHDAAGTVPVLDTAEREARIQSGTHYSEMLPVEYQPSDQYMDLFQKTLDPTDGFIYETADAVARLSHFIKKRHAGHAPVLVSLARAGIPVGVLIKRYFKYAWGMDVPHYAISIIRDRGFDETAMKYIAERHDPAHIQFIDGWIGKGAITRELHSEVMRLRRTPVFRHLSPDLASLSDPGRITSTCGTRMDFLIPSSLLNATVTGGLSRTVRPKSQPYGQMDGAVYYENLKDQDVTYQFINTVERLFPAPTLTLKAVKIHEDANPPEADAIGMKEVKRIAGQFGVNDLNKIKPGIGEATRVLLRRVPHCVVLNPKVNPRYTQHLVQLAKEKDVPIEYQELACYNAIGIIKDLADA